MTGRGIIFEFVRLGNSVKVTAIDPVSLIEVSLVGPASGDQAALRRAALRKLEFMRARLDKGGDKAV